MLCKDNKVNLDYKSMICKKQKSIWFKKNLSQKQETHIMLN